jgi:hypothetical protein
MENARETILKNIEKEFDKFRDDNLKQTKEQIFEDYFKINFYCEVRTFLNESELSDRQYERLAEDGGSLLNALWEKYLKWEDISVGSYEDIENLIDEYIRYATEDQDEM